MAIKKDTWIDKIADAIISFFEKLNKTIDKYPIVGRLLGILLVVGIILYGLSWIVWGFASCIVWFITAVIEICLMPVHFLIWIFIGKFPMFEMHEYILKKLKMFDLVYQKS